MNPLLRIGALALALSLCTSWAVAQSTPASPAPAQACKHKTKRLGNAEVDALPAQPAGLFVSHHAARAGAAGSEDYERAGGLAVVHIQPLAPVVAAASALR